MQDLSDVPWQKKMRTANGYSKKRLPPPSPLTFQQQQLQEDGDVDQLLLQEALESIVVPHIFNALSPIITETVERRVEYWKHRCKEVEKKLKEVLRQTKCPTCQKENLAVTRVLQKGNKKRANTQAIVASAAASATRRKGLATVPENTATSNTVEHPESLMNVNELQTDVIALSSYERVLEVNSSSSSVSSRNEVRTPPYNPKQHRLPPKSAPQPETFKYVEVVRNRAERRSLNGHTCPECDAFAKFVLQARDSHGNVIYDPKDIVQACSRHRNLLSQGETNTPEDFWELSFADSIERRRKKSSQYETSEGGENLQQTFDS